jgi:hypothetical protein
MLFFTSSRSRRDPASWLSRSKSMDAEATLNDAGTALRHAGEDLAEAARMISEDASRHLRDSAAAARAEAERQVRANAKAARAEGKRQLRRGAKALRANAAAVPDELLPAGRDAVRKSVERFAPGRKKQARRSPLFRILGVMTATGLALLGAQLLMTRLSSGPSRRRERSPEGTMPLGTRVAGIPDTLGMVGSMRTPAEVSPDEMTEPATFDRDAGIRAATEGMELREAEGNGSPSQPAEIADGT